MHFGHCSLSNSSSLFSNSGGALPTPLVAGTTYYVQEVASTGVYKLSATAGGALIDLTSAGTGTSYLGEVPTGIRSWMLLRIGTMYQNRDEGSEIKGRQFCDSLLDDFRVKCF